LRKILFIDTFCEFGHNNINKIYIDELIRIGYDVHLAMKRSYFNALELDQSLLKIDLPEKYFLANGSKVINRINQVRLLNFIKNRTKNINYFFYFFSYFEEISFYLSGFNGVSYLMVHGNTEGLINPVKKHFLRRISKNPNIKYLVFLEEFKRMFNSNGIYNVIVSPHGLPTNNSYDLSEDKNYFEKITKDLKFSKGKSKIIFIPHSNKFGDTFTNDLVNHNLFLEFIKKKNLKIIIKGNYIPSNSDRIFFLPNFVEEKQFRALLANSAIVLLNYPTSFQYRVSGLFFECLSKNIPLIASKITSFTHYSEIFNYNPFYSTVDELITIIDSLTSVEDGFAPYKNLQQIKLELSQIL
jgi:hypothetical protein